MGVSIVCNPHLELPYQEHERSRFNDIDDELFGATALKFLQIIANDQQTNQKTRTVAQKIATYLKRVLAYRKARSNKMIIEFVNNTKFKNPDDMFTDDIFTIALTQKRGSELEKFCAFNDKQTYFWPLVLQLAKDKELYSFIPFIMAKMNITDAEYKYIIGKNNTTKNEQRYWHSVGKNNVITNNKERLALLNDLKKLHILTKKDKHFGAAMDEYFKNITTFYMPIDLACLITQFRDPNKELRKLENQ